MRRLSNCLAVLGLLAAADCAQAAGRLVVSEAWIREAPPGATMLAGYAKLENAGDEPVSVLTVQSDAFRMASLHETIVADGVSKMRDLHRLDLAPGAAVALEPGGRHLMLMQPRQEVHAGDRIEVRFLLGDGTRKETVFEVIAPDSGDEGTDARHHH
jgi:copper(I)-binding protein